jgi:phage/conjugal plasmid C-4 type zinc finger TraR family protein
MDGKTLEQLRNSLIEISAPQAEIIDIAQSLEQLGRDTSLAEQERRELLAVERALAKMASGSFGICEECAEEIPQRRLMVLPEARLCAHCQAYEERQNSRIRHSSADFR